MNHSETVIFIWNIVNLIHDSLRFRLTIPGPAQLGRLRYHLDVTEYKTLSLA